MIYLNNASTTMPDKEVIEDYVYCAEKYWHNPSDISDQGLEAKQIINDAKLTIKDSIGASVKDDIIFTSGGTEANNLAIKGYCEANDVDVIITTKMEHSSIYNTCLYMAEKRGIKVEYIENHLGSLKYYNFLNKEDSTVLTLLGKYRNKKVLVTISHVNNEIGKVCDIALLSKYIKQIIPTAVIHVDAVQSYMHMVTDVNHWNIDLMSTSFHKYGGLTGGGFLYVRNGVKISPIIHGGKQFNYLRSGTENVPMIYAMGKHTTRRLHNYYDNAVKCEKLMDLLLNSIHDVDKGMFGMFGNDHFVLTPISTDSDRIVNIHIKNINANLLITMLEEQDIYISAGSACSAGENKPSRVLKAIGLSDKDALSCIRVSLSENNSFAEMEIFAEKLKECIISLIATGNTMLEENSQE